MSLPSKKLKNTYALLVLSYSALLLILLAQTFSHAPEDSQWWQGVILWLFKILPLLFVLKGLLEKRHRSATWLSFLSMLYFIFGVLLIFTRGAELYGWLMSADTLVLYTVSMLYTRWKREAEAVN